MRTVLLPPLLVAVAACTAPSDKDTGLADACPVAAATPLALTWTDLALGGAVDEEVSVSNDCSGTSSLTVSASVDDARFSVDPAELSVPPGEVGTLVVTAVVEDYEEALGTLTLGTDDPAAPSLAVGLSALAAADQDGDGSTHEDDCDDLDATVYPGATERCGDAVDQDCDGEASLGGCVASLSRSGARLTGVEPGDLAGVSLDVEDLNGDGYFDVLVGAYLNDAGGTDAGAAYLVPGPVSGVVSLTAAEAKWTGGTAGDQAGLGVAVAGDVDASGLPDMLIGASSAGEGGKAYLLYDPSTSSGGSLLSGNAWFLGENPSDEAGLAVAGAGDVDADGYADILVGAPGNEANGAAYLLHGPLAHGALDLAGADAKLSGDGTGDEAGHDVAGAGDVDGDGFGDFLVGAPNDDDGGTDAGATYLVLGPPAAGVTALGDADAKLVGTEAGGRASDHSLLGGVDLNDDGFDDVIVGSCSGGGPGGASLVYGPFAGVLGLGSADVAFHGEDDEDSAGYAPAAGDVDGDGALDLVLGAPGAEPTGSSPHQVGYSYLLYGPFAGSYDLASADVTLMGHEEDDQAGGANALADVDGDGLADILVGAVGDDYAGSMSGAVYLYFAADL